MTTITPEIRKQLVAKAARTLFVKKGFDSVSIPEIVEMSGVSTGAIYNYYGSKSALARQVYKNSAEEFEQLFNIQVQNKETTYDKLISFAKLLWDLTEKDRSLVEYLFLVTPATLAKEYSPVMGTPCNCILCKIFEEGMLRGEVPPGDPATRAVAFWGVVVKSIEMMHSGFLTRPQSQDTSTQIAQRAWRAAYS